MRYRRFQFLDDKGLELCTAGVLLVVRNEQARADIFAAFIFLRVLQSRIDKFQEIVSWFTLLERDLEGNASLIHSLDSLQTLVISLEEERCQEELKLANRLYATEYQIVADVLRAESLLRGLDDMHGPAGHIKSALVDMEEKNKGLRDELTRIEGENKKNLKEARTLAESAQMLSKSNGELVKHNMELENENKQLKSARNELVDKAEMFRLQQEVSAAREETKAAKREIERLKEEHMVQKKFSEMEAKTLESNLEREKSACQRAQTISKSLEEEIEVLKTETRRQSSELVRAKTEAEGKQREIDGLRVKLDSLDISKSLEEEIEVLKTETRRQSSELVHAKTETERKQREIDGLRAKLDSCEESKRERDEELSHLRAQAVGAQARINSFEHRERELAAEIKAVGDIKVRVMMITSDMRDLAHRAHSEKNQLENINSESERSAKFWKQEAESAQQALNSMKQGDIVKDSISQMKSAMEQTRSELARTQDDLTKRLDHSEEERFAKDKLLSEKSARIRRLETEISELQEHSTRIQGDLSKASAGKDIRNKKPNFSANTALPVLQHVADIFVFCHRNPNTTG